MIAKEVLLAISLMCNSPINGMISHQIKCTKDIYECVIKGYENKDYLNKSEERIVIKCLEQQLKK